MFRKRIGKALLRLAFESIRDDLFELETVKLPDGKKVKRHVPNERLGVLLGEYAPGLIDWASKNIKIKLPPLTLPEGMDLKQVGVSVLAQKALSGKKLGWQDAIPLGLGYAKDLLEKAGILEKLQGIVGKGPAAKKAGTGAEAAAEAYIKELTP